MFQLLTGPVVLKVNIEVSRLNGSRFRDSRKLSFSLTIIFSSSSWGI